MNVYGIKTCSTVKKALRWLESAGVSATFVDYRKTPVSEEVIATWVEQVGAKPLKNTSGGSYRALGAEKKTWTDAQWVRAFATDNMLIKRPVICENGRVLQVGFRGTEDELKERLLK